MGKNKFTKNQLRLERDCSQIKHRVRLYKKGRNWIATGITTVAFGLVTLAGGTTAQAAPSQSTSADSVATQSDADSIADATQATLKSDSSSDDNASKQIKHHLQRQIPVHRNWIMVRRKARIVRAKTQVIVHQLTKLTAHNLVVRPVCQRVPIHRILIVPVHRPQRMQP